VGGPERGHGVGEAVDPLPPSEPEPPDPAVGGRVTASGTRSSQAANRTVMNFR
jgi:hypothetical protein